MPNACGMTSRRAPFCPSCGQLASHWSEYHETTSGVAIITNVLVQLSWVCDGCHFDVTVSARTPVPELNTNAPIPSVNTNAPLPLT